MGEYNSKLVSETLKRLVTILNENDIRYRFLGSVVVAGINGKLHRKLGDLDLIIGADKKDLLFSKLKSLGYKQADGMFAFGRKYMCLETLEHPHLLGVGYFYGDWLTDGSFKMGGNHFNITIDPIALKETGYSLGGVLFIGIPERASATGTFTSITNPKRKIERFIFNEKGVIPFPNNYIHVHAFGINADWLYHVAMSMLNFIGGIRVRLGLAFDPWRQHES